MMSPFAERLPRVLYRGVALFLVAATAVGCWLKPEHRPLYASLPTPITVLGRHATVDIDVHNAAPGLRSAAVRLRVGDATTDLLHEEYPAAGWFRRAVTDKRLHVEADLVQLNVPEGGATLEVLAESYDAAPTVVLSLPVSIDLTPPQIELLTTQHTVRLGGTEVAVFRQSPDAVQSGVAVEQYFFPAVTGQFADSGVAVAFFAVPENLDAKVQPHVTARDAAGNQVDVVLPCRIVPRVFAARVLTLNDDFLERKVPAIERAGGLRPSGSLLDRYLHINREVRRQNEARIRELTSTSAPHPLWNGVFHIQPNTVSTSSFADRRSYAYGGAEVDRQTHLGCDLAAPGTRQIVATQDGIVVYTGDLGVYGETVILDHGLGIFSLYGHLASIAVRPGEHVTQGQSLGPMGETGLASGAHLHFSIMVSGVHVDPMEWWHTGWFDTHVVARLASLPPAKQAAPP